MYTLAKVVSVYLGVVSIAMLLRVLLQFFVSEDNKILLFCALISEPIIIPFRLLFNKLNIGQKSPLDIPFFAAYFSIFLIEMILPTI